MTDGRHGKAGRRGMPITLYEHRGRYQHPLLDGANERDSGAEAYTGAGGNASGGNVEGGGGLINLFSGAYRTLGRSIAPDRLSDNGGDGGDASSGDAFAFGEGAKAKAYSGPGGNASGGSIKDEKPGYGHGYRSGGLVDVASGVYP